jgi:hypothetical protein
MFGKIAQMLGLSKASVPEEIAQVINMYDALLAHAAWKKRLTAYLEGHSKEVLEPGKIGVDHLCMLGKWIHSDGKAHFGEQPEFIKLVEEHAKFHRHAAKVVEAHQLGNTTLAQEILTSSFEDQSRRTVICLTKLNTLVEAKSKESTT